MIEVPGRGQEHRVAGLRDEHQRGDESHVAAGRDGDVGGFDVAAGERREMAGIGGTQVGVAGDRAVARGVDARRRLDEPRHEIGMRRMPGTACDMLISGPCAPP